MKIAFAMKYYSPKKGGAEARICDLAEYLYARGHDIHIFAQRAEETCDKFTFHPVPARSFSNLLRILSFASNCAEEMRKGKFDIIQVFDKTTWYANVFLSHNGTFHGANRRYAQAVERPALRPLKLVERYFSLRRLAFLFIERRLLHSPDLKRVIAISKMVRQDMMRHWKLPGDRVELIYNGVDLERFNPSHREVYREKLRSRFGLADDYVLLFIGHNFKRKGLLPLFRAMERIVRSGSLPELKAVIVGGGDPGAWGAQAARLGLSERVIFPGKVNNTAEYYSIADVFVLPTFYDPCALSVLEALASGLPVITTKDNGSSELITDGVEGFVLSSPRDTEELSRRIVELADPELRARLSGAARALAERYSLQRNLEEITRVYEEFSEKRLILHTLGAPRVLQRSKDSVLRFKYNELQVSMAGTDGAHLAHVSAVLRGIDRLAERGALIGGWFDVHRYVTRMEASGGEGLYLKLTFLRSWFDLVKDLFRPSRARREQRGNELVRDAGLRSLHVVAVGEKRLRGVARRSLVVTAEADGTPLSLYLESLYEDRDAAEARRRKRDLIVLLAMEVSRLHAAGLCHGDLRPNNVLVRDTWPPEFVFIDNERTRRGRSGRRGTRRNLLQINFFFSKRLTLTDRLRFLRAYSGPGGPPGPGRTLRSAGGSLNRRQQEMARWVAIRSKRRIIEWLERIEVPVDPGASYAALISRVTEVQAERRKRGEATEGSIRV